MKRCIPLLLAIGLGFQAHAEVNSVDRSKRAFRKDATTGVVYADLVVAYEPVPASVLLGGKTVRQYLEESFVQASLDLFIASKGAVPAFANRSFITGSLERLVVCSFQCVSKVGYVIRSSF